MAVNIHNAWTYAARIKSPSGLGRVRAPCCHKYFASIYLVLVLLSQHADSKSVIPHAWSRSAASSAAVALSSDGIITRVPTRDELGKPVPHQHVRPRGSILLYTDEDAAVLAAPPAHRSSEPHHDQALLEEGDSISSKQAANISIASSNGPRIGALSYFLLGFLVVGMIVVIGGIIAGFATKKGDTMEKTDSDSKDEPQLDMVDEDLYGLAIVTVILDTQRCAAGTEAKLLRMARLAISLQVLIFTCVVQVFLISEVSNLVVDERIHQIRTIYDQYEATMYGTEPGHTFKTVNGFRRGNAEYFEANRFASLTPDVKDLACRVPLSQPTFTMSVLLVWTLTCVAQFRRCMSLMANLLITTPTIPSMSGATEIVDGEVLVQGLTASVKALLTVVIFLPRLCVTLFMLWLGLRWLTATLSFEDVLINAVALEFILLLQNLMYKAMAPSRSKREMEDIRIMTKNQTEGGFTVSNSIGSFGWAFLAIIIVFAYMYAGQAVLPDYQWDLHDTCKDYLTQQRSGTAPV